MPLLFRENIWRVDLQLNRNILFLFGDNEARYGLGGQARECRGEPNAVGVRTKKKPSRDNDAYWSDNKYDKYVEMIDEDFKRAFDHILAGGTVVCPMAKLGSGMSELPTRAPKLYRYIEYKISELGRLGNMIREVDTEISDRYLAQKGILKT
ncbi:hypothetical protein EVB94_237 [Rhizobium phage RHph_TM40]|uniref:DUF7831 domain-containing protein n=2 Tax=Cuauhnahuacvirus TaxID=3044696 RepID=A0A7S5UW01_9CAUD|nr:hypothetical protein PQC16_gp237 [Rhizobium phage RHph_TM30]YP_010671386.1 hypothetical protein PQC17_gp237 [Rhizobium phage RHph_Y65]QIG71708.1 hypothetical protein EVB94_237 [Rhizobium phage RHph_TM40]QIG72071.1 hypothetical protein EVB95_237 [Rhizobium phage RHph_TM2_3B]QIG72433.1 hypothetical protein EVB96_237 [Rhizobium phage RHph_TM3_3_6]QIG77823.1 hypothetical protein EVB64_236 [Rhizobium phage RHph_TM61]QIG71344.1 hypothetical protein EVB93_237 [Rhizobium phage RHph_TM30]